MQNLVKKILLALAFCLSPISAFASADSSADSGQILSAEQNSVSVAGVFAGGHGGQNIKGNDGFPPIC